MTKLMGMRPQEYSQLWSGIHRKNCAMSCSPLTFCGRWLMKCRCGWTKKGPICHTQWELVEAAELTGTIPWHATHIAQELSCLYLVVCLPLVTWHGQDRYARIYLFQWLLGLSPNAAYQQNSVWLTRRYLRKYGDSSRIMSFRSFEGGSFIRALDIAPGPDLFCQ